MSLSPFRHPFVSPRRVQSLLPTPWFPCQFGLSTTHLGAATKVLDVCDRDRNLRHGNLLWHTTVAGPSAANCHRSATLDRNPSAFHTPLSSRAAGSEFKGRAAELE